MAFGRDIVITLADGSIAEEDVQASLEKFVSVTSLTSLPAASAAAAIDEAPPPPRRLHARLHSSTHADYLLNVLSGKLRVGGYLCSFARPDEESDTEDEDTLVEDHHGSFHHDGFLSPLQATAPMVIPQMEQSSVFLTPPQSLSETTLGEESPMQQQLQPVLQSPRSGSAAVATPQGKSCVQKPQQPRTPALLTIPIGLHPEFTLVDPSPARPQTRQPCRRRVAELAEIFARGAGCVAAKPQLAPIQGGEKAAFLALAPPYHLLPNTQYFRNAPIAPPPVAPPLPVAGTQRIINRYIASMKVMDDLEEMEVQSLMCFNFNRTIGACPYTMPEKAALELRVLDDSTDDVNEGWSVWAEAATAPPVLPPASPQLNKRTSRLTH